jgi:hypothetical protein
MIESLVIAGAVLASAILLSYTLRPKEDADAKIRMTARTLVRAVEKRAQWDQTIDSEHVKRARVRLALMEMFPSVEDDWLDVIIEEAVFDMEASSGSNTTASSAGGHNPDRVRPIGEYHPEDVVLDFGDREYIGTGTAPNDWAPGDFGLDDSDTEDYPIPSAES